MNAKSRLWRQIFRFAIVGGLSTLIDASAFAFFYSYLRLNNELVSLSIGRALVQHGWCLHPVPVGSTDIPLLREASVPVIQLLDAAVAIPANFMLNRSWTFEAKSKAALKSQLSRYTVVILVALTVQELIVSGVSHALPIWLAKGLAIVASIGITFILQRSWTFRSLDQHAE